MTLLQDYKNSCKRREIYELLEAGLSIRIPLVVKEMYFGVQPRAELEEIALPEADVAMLKQKVAELHHQLNQQHQNHYGSLSDASNCYQQVQNSQQRFLAQDFDSTLALYNHERKQGIEEGDRRAIKGQSNKLGSGKQYSNTSPLSDSKSTEASATISMDDLGIVDSTSDPLMSRLFEYRRHPAVASSSTVVELTTRLDFFKKQCSQLMEQLHNLDSNYGNGNTPPSQDFLYRSSSPPWS